MSLSLQNIHADMERTMLVRIAAVSDMLRTSLAPGHLRDLGTRHPLRALASRCTPCTPDTDFDLQAPEAQLIHCSWALLHVAFLLPTARRSAHSQMSIAGLDSVAAFCQAGWHSMTAVALLSRRACTCRPLRMRICNPLLGRNPGSNSASARLLIRTKSFVAPACSFPPSFCQLLRCCGPPPVPTVY